jgi:hypothetical protein
MAGGKENNYDRESIEAIEEIEGAAEEKNGIETKI